jgi:hypothetical protein
LLRHIPFRHMVPAIWASIGSPVTCCMNLLASCCACAITCCGFAGCVAESMSPGTGAHGGVVHELVAAPNVGSIGGFAGVPCSTAAASGDCGIMVTGGGPAGAPLAPVMTSSLISVATCDPDCECGAQHAGGQDGTHRV